MVCEHEQLIPVTTQTSTAELFIPFFYTDAMLFVISLNQRLYSWKWRGGVGVYKMKKPLLFVDPPS